MDESRNKMDSTTVSAKLKEVNIRFKCYFFNTFTVYKKTLSICIISKINLWVNQWLPLNPMQYEDVCSIKKEVAW